jgi:hypothetical protein
MSTLQQTPIEQFKLPGKLIRILHRNHIHTFGDLQDAVNQENLLRLRGVAKKTAGELTRLAADISAQPDLYLVTANQYNVNDGKNTPQAQNRSELLAKLDQVGVEKLDLPPRIFNALTRAGICTIGDLLLIKPSQLSRIHLVGPKSARKLQIVLEQVLSSPENYVK